MINVILNVDPYPKARPRLGSNGVVFTPKKSKDNENLIKYELRFKTDRTLYETPLRVEIDFYISRPKSVSKKRVFPNVRPDLDNFCKQVFDSGNNYIWKDDGVICELFSRKFYTEGKGYIHLVVTEL